MKHGWYRAGLSGMLILLLLTGYASLHANKPLIGQFVGLQESAAIPTSQPIVQSRKERQLVLLFQALLQMDGKDGLSISKEQAEALLPLVRSSRDQGDLSADQQQLALKLLNTGQLAFYNDLASKMRERMSGVAGKNPEEFTQEERDRLIEQFQERRDHPPPGSPDADSIDDSGGPPGPGFGKSMEQQLIELLESKAMQ